MTALPAHPTLTDFLAWERGEEGKHEYADGVVTAFAGGTKRHAAIARELLTVLHSSLRGGPCEVFGSDVSVVTERSARYPDVVVTCDERDTNDFGETTVRYPRLIVEILSESTAAIDRGDKLDEYRTLASLREYVLIDSRRRWIQTYRRTDEEWIAALPRAAGELHLHSLEITLAIDDLYRGAGLDSPEAPH